MITATASIAAGQSMMRAAADTMKRLTLELGGQCPFVVLDDADVAEAAAAAARRSFSNMGQICIAVNRILVADRLHDAFLRGAGRGGRQDQTRPRRRAGRALWTGAARGRARAARASISKMRCVAAGGWSPAAPRPQGEAFDAGFFFRPTVVDGADDARAGDDARKATARSPPCAECATTTRRWRSPTRCPMALRPMCYSRDLERAWAFAEKLEFGAVGVNVNDTTELQAPFGGWKLSGVGRELGPEGLAAYRESKHIKLRVRGRIATSATLACARLRLR